MKLNAFEEYKNLRVLILEDSPEDAELMLDELDRVGMLIEAEITDNRPSFTDKLIHFSPDIVLSDYSLPEINGIEALTIVREEYPDIPFVFVTGTIGEEIAAETILNGASGLVLKSNLNKLPEVIQSILDERGKWYSKRLEWVSRRIHKRIQKNIEALDRIQDFLKVHETTPMEISDDLTSTLNDLRNLHEDFISEDDNT